MTWMMALFGGYYLLSQGFDSLLRWVFELVKIGPLIYARDGLMLFAIVLGYVDLVAHMRAALLPLALLTFVLVGGLISATSELSAQQVIFGIKVWLPLLFGVALTSSDAVRSLHRPRLWAWVWGLLVFGIVLNVYVTYPWAGMLMQVGDTEVVANREWTAQSYNRASGFSRTSFDAAIYVILLAFYLVTTTRSLARRVLIWLLSGAAIVLTTTKGAILAWLISTVVLPLVLSLRPEDARGLPVRRVIACTTVSLFGVFGALIPLVAGQLWQGGFEEGTVEDLLFASFGDRVFVTWPFAFSLISGWQYVTGRGIGGIGAAQAYFELDRFSPGDNLFVYVYITAGLVGAVMYLLPLLGMWQLKLTSLGDRLAFFVLLFVFPFGMTVNVVESAIALMAIGAAVAQLAKRQPSSAYEANYGYREYTA